MVDFEKYNQDLVPASIMVVDDLTTLLASSQELELWLQQRWLIKNKKTISLGLNNGEEYSLELKRDRSVSVNIIYIDSDGINIIDSNIEAAFYIYDDLRKDFPELDNNLVFINSHGEIAQFPFNCGDDELCRRIGLEEGFLDHDLMQGFGLE